MNCYTNECGHKYYCLDPINSNHTYFNYCVNGIEILECDDDESKTPLHRIGGPAIEYDNGDKYWCFMGKYHRDDGPAVEYPGGNKYWYYHGENIKCKSIEEFLKIINMKAFI